MCSEAHIEKYNDYAMKSFSSSPPPSVLYSVHCGLAFQNRTKSPFLDIINWSWEICRGDNQWSALNVREREHMFAEVFHG